jgi:CTP:molybdopterin cytidylyltransferase MocA
MSQETLAGTGDELEGRRDAAIVVLASCPRGRLGRGHQLFQFGRRTLLRHVAVEALATGVRPVIVVAGTGAEDYAAEVQDLDVWFFHQSDWEGGLDSSFRAALEAVELGGIQPRRLMVTGCHEPTIHRELLVDLLELQAASGRPVAVCEYREEVSMPVVFDRGMFAELRGLVDDRAARSLLRGSANRVARLPFRNGEVEGDVVAELQNLQRHVRSRARDA